MSSKVDNPFENQETSNAYEAVDEVYQKSAHGIKDFCTKFDAEYFSADKNIVDLGAGTGVSSEILKEDFDGVFILAEPSKAMMAHAYKRLGDSVTYVQTTADEMYNCFKRDIDTVFALNCIHLFPDWTQAFAGVAASLKKGGHFVFNITAPSYAFENITDIEKDIYQANIDFYKALNAKVQNPILESTVTLLENSLEGASTEAVTKESMTKFLEALNFELLETEILEIETTISYQEKIWQMMGNSFLQDSKAVDELIASIKLPSKMLVRQAVFLCENKN